MLTTFHTIDSTFRRTTCSILTSSASARLCISNKLFNTTKSSLLFTIFTMAGPFAPEAHRPQPQTTSSYAQRTSSESATSSSSESSAPSHSTYADPSPPRVEVLRCSRCAKCVETITHSPESEGSQGVSLDDLSASGMVRFGHNLYYCDRCAKIVGYT